MEMRVNGGGEYQGGTTRGNESDFGIGNVGCSFRSNE